MVFGEEFSISYNLFLSACVFFVVYVLTVILKKPHLKFPPGPTGFPIVGYLPFLVKNGHLKLMKLGEKYGGVFSVTLGSERVVILNDLSTVKNALVKNEFQGRPDMGAFALFGNKSAFFSSDLEAWREQKKFVNQSFKELVREQSRMKDSIQDEIQQFVEFLNSKSGEPVYFESLLAASVSNNIFSLIFGKRYEYDDPEIHTLNRNVDEVIRIVGQMAVHIFLPWIRHFPLLMRWLDLEKAIKAFNETADLYKRKIEEHKEEHGSKETEDFIGHYLKEMREREGNNEKSAFSEDMLMSHFLDLFGAGSESTRGQISWCIYTMAAHQDIQKKVQQEILEVIGPDRKPEFTDQKSMPYTHAVILETIRWSSLVPINLLRCTTTDTTLNGYDIPAGTIILANFWAIHRDPKIWTDPEKFLPERFLSSDRKNVKRSSDMVPFSLGKRSCPGENLAIYQIFLYFTTLLQNFEIRFPTGVQGDFDAEITSVHKLKPYKLFMIPKSESSVFKSLYSLFNYGVSTLQASEISSTLTLPFTWGDASLVTEIKTDF